MLLYLTFTVIWTAIVVSRASTMRRINRSAIRPLEKFLAKRGIPHTLRRSLTILLKLSIIPFGVIWASLLVFRNFRPASAST